MTSKEYISGRFQSFGIQLSEADLLDMSLRSSIGLDDEVDGGTIDQVSVGIVRFIPTLLLRATSISESGFSMSWNIDGIKSYYSMLCKQYGLEDELNTNKPKISFL